MTTPSSTRDLIRVFGRIGLLSFGGPAAQIALMHRELVEARSWLSERQFLNALSFCMLLPGPEAMQLATYAGWRLRGVAGGLLAGGLFVLPGAAIILTLAMLYARFGQLPLVEAVFLGIKSAVIIIVIQALFKLAQRALTSRLAYFIAAAGFLGLFVFQLPFPLLILGAGLIGAVFMAGEAQSQSPPLVPITSTLRICLIFGALWLGPLAALWLLAPDGFLTEVGVFFSKLAVVSFGGAYAVLAYMVQAVVADFGWLSTGQMMDALGLAETTPGPLILVTEFVGFVAGQSHGGTGFGVAAGLVTLWATFMPCFLWIFAGAPYVDWISQQPRLTGALKAIAASVVGVIANLSVWFALHVWFSQIGRIGGEQIGLWWPVGGSLSGSAVALSLVAAVLLVWRKLDLLVVLGIMAACGACLSLI